MRTLSSLLGRGCTARRSLPLLGGVAAALALFAHAETAQAASGIDSPENGIDQIGRGSAWIARADSPIATYYNPAALAFQSSGVYVGVDIMFRKQCYTRVNQDGSPYAPAPGFGLQNGAAGQAPAETCADKGAFPLPSLAANFRINKQFAIGISVLPPHTYGKNSWPETVTFDSATGGQKTQPAPNRYLLTDSSALLIFPTLGIGYAPTSNFAIGASFIWGIANLSFTNFAEALSPMQPGSPVDNFVNNSDLKATLKFKDLFVPGFVIGTTWAPARTLDVAGSFKWMDSIRSSQADLNVLSRYWSSNGTPNPTPCAATEASNCNVTDKPGVGTVRFSLPMEARIGTRFHIPRQSIESQPAWADPDKNGGKIVKDPLSQDKFDIEVDFTWSNDSAVDALHLSFQPGLQVAGTPGTVPTVSDIAHNWKDVFGARLGGDVNIIPNLFALRAGGWIQSKGQDDQHLTLDFDNSWKAGIAAGGTIRLGNLVDVHAAYQHTFWGTIDNGGKGALNAISGDQTAPGHETGASHSQQLINGGRLASAMDEFGLAAQLHF